MGDFNLSHRNPVDQAKLDKLCQGQKRSVLNEITRAMSNNQLEYILLDVNMKGNYFVTSYNNFISDHKTIVARIASCDNRLTNEIKEKITFDEELHMRSREIPENEFDPCQSPIEDNLPTGQRKRKGKARQTTGNTSQIKSSFTRKFENPDMATCWLNSCLQLILTAMEDDEYVLKSIFNSELGQELLRLQSCSKNQLLDPTLFKDIIVTAEDVRIATRLSELSYAILDKKLLTAQSRQIANLRLDLRNGQQCVRDFFICLNENLISWPDVYSWFSFQLTHSTECSSCKHRNESETTQIYLEIPVPPDGAHLKNYIEEYLNEGTKVGCYCQEGCNAFSEKRKRISLTNSDEAKFLIIILTRGIETLDGFQLVKSKINSTDIINIR